MNITAVFIQSVITEDTGGGCLADVLLLKSGQVVAVCDECIALYPSMPAWNHEVADFGDELAPIISDSFARADNNAQRSPCGLAFIDAISSYEPDGPVSVDLVVLCDGRVIGIDADSVVLYPSMEAFDAITQTGETADWPSLSLVGV